MKYNLYMKQYKVTYMLAAVLAQGGTKYVEEPYIDFKKEPLEDIFIGTIETDKLQNRFIYTHFEDLKKKADKQRKLNYVVCAAGDVDYSDLSQKIYIGYYIKNTAKEGSEVLIDFIPKEEFEEEVNQAYEDAHKKWQKQVIEESPSLNKLCDLLNINKEEVDLSQLKKLIEEYQLETMAKHLKNINS